MKKTNFIDINIFIASPTDTYQERNKIARYIKSEWNPKIGESLGVRLIVKMWESDMPVTSAKTPQEVIDELLLKSSDILIGMFWKKFGFLVTKGVSATSHEIETFLSLNKPVILYFSNKKTDPQEVNPNEMSNILEFKKKYAESNIYSEVDPKKTLIPKLERDLNFNIERLIRSNQDAKEQEMILTSKKLPNSSTDSKRWYNISITKEINKYMSDNGFSHLIYNNRLPFYENLELWKLREPQHGKLIRVAETARENAFETKYGNYDYHEDLRSMYADWFSPIQDVLRYHNLIIENKKVLAVAANKGQELDEIFGDRLNKSTFDVLDICNQAIKEGREIYKDSINFFHGNMESIEIADANHSYDLYLNLRSIHSNGVDQRKTIRECLKVLKPNGTAIFSISNGYLDKSQVVPKEIKGMYDTYQGLVNTHTPFQFASDIRLIMEEYKFELMNIHSFHSEIFVYGKKYK